MVTKVAVGKAGGVDYTAEDYVKVAKVYCYACKQEIDKANPVLTSIVDSIMLANSAIESSKIEEWEHELKPCPHTRGLVQIAGLKPFDKTVLAHCNECPLSANMWLCLTCGHLGCGRHYVDGTGGNNHAIDHNKGSGHPVVVKMGTITPDGKACKLL